MDDEEYRRKQIEWSSRHSLNAELVVSVAAIGVALLAIAALL